MENTHRTVLTALNVLLSFERRTHKSEAVSELILEFCQQCISNMYAAARIEKIEQLSNLIVKNIECMCPAAISGIVLHKTYALKAKERRERMLSVNECNK